MNRIKEKKIRFNRRKVRVKNKFKKINSGKMRMCISRSNKSFYVQIIDDKKGETVVAASTLAKDFSELKNRGNIEAAKKLGWGRTTL